MGKIIKLSRADLYKEFKPRCFARSFIDQRKFCEERCQHYNLCSQAIEDKLAGRLIIKDTLEIKKKKELG